MQFKTLNDFDFKGKTVFVRADLNVPAKNGVISDLTRIERFAPTMKEIADKGGKVVVASHFGRPDGEVKPEFSMAFMVPELEKASGLKVEFCTDCIGEQRDEMIKAMKPGDVILLENVRFHKGEEANDKAFAEALASGIDIYIDDAFSTAHRAHASTEGIAHLLPRGAGRLMQEELEALDKALGNPTRPAVALVGGSKVSTKLDLLGNLVKKVDYLCIGGAMANTFLAAKGYKMGDRALVEVDMLDTARAVLANAGECTIVLPVDLLCVDNFGDAGTFVSVDDLPENKIYPDVGPKSIAAIIDVVQKCKTVIWNGPLGAFETKPYDRSTNEVAAVVAKLTKEGKIVSVGGGGDTVSALKKAGVEPDLTYISAAGGAFLEWMEGKSLPGVSILEK